MTDCARCGTSNDDGAAFCAGCGASLAAQMHCPTCNALNPLGRKFCTQCGGGLEYAGWGEPADPGAVVDGAWERGGNELIRRVDPEEARRFLGARTVRVPAGTVGVVLVDGVVERILPPGERTSVTLFQRVANFFTGRERTAFYLVDQRPFPVPFVVQTRPAATGALVKTQVLVTFSLPKGDRDALAQFIANVMRERPAVTTGDLYNLLRPEVAQLAQEELERSMLGGELSLPAAEVAIRRRLAESVARRYGLAVDATLAPLAQVAAVTLRLDKLFTADAQAVELDVVVRVQGPPEAVSEAALQPVLAAALGAQLRGIAFGAIGTHFAALEQAATPAVKDALAGLGLTLVGISVLDARSATGQWLLGARAELERRAAEVRVGLDRLEQRDAELDLEQLVLVRGLREEQQRRDQRFAQDTAAVDDRERRETLAARGAAMDIAAVQRQSGVAAARDAAEHERAQRAAVLRHTQVDAEVAELRARRGAELDLRALEEQQQIEKLRAMAQLDRELAAQEHAQELEKRAQLRGLTPDEMIAAQAGELAKAEGGGAAWAAALASRGDVERRHAAEQREVYEQAMGAMANVAASRAAPAAVGVVVPIGASGGDGGRAPAATRECPQCHAGVKPDARFCGACGQTL
ncbi:MAG TPA: zinc ribbon domain-containing protein [Kofleriaceae bacterium]|jgi:hypothetical protein